MTKRWLVCLVGAAIMLNGCTPKQTHLTAGKTSTPPPATQSLPPPSQQTQPAKPSTPGAPPPATSTAIVPDATDALVKQVDALYASGMADYRAGNLEKSKQEFDQAVATLLESGLDIQGDERLSSEFDKIVENVYSVEAASLEHGDALSLHNYEPTPLESFSGLTFPGRSPHNATRTAGIEIGPFGFAAGFQRLRGRSYHLHAEPRPRLCGKHPAQVGNVRADHQRRPAEGRACPQDLIYLAAGESAFNPLAVSNKQCVGIWQFSQADGRPLRFEEGPLGG